MRSIPACDMNCLLWAGLSGCISCEGCGPWAVRVGDGWGELEKGLTFWCPGQDAFFEACGLFSVFLSAVLTRVAAAAATVASALQSRRRVGSQHTQPNKAGHRPAQHPGRPTALPQQTLATHMQTTRKSVPMAGDSRSVECCLSKGVLVETALLALRVC